MLRRVESDQNLAPQNPQPQKPKIPRDMAIDSSMPCELEKKFAETDAED
jgi:hypothetical protein